MTKLLHSLFLFSSLVLFLTCMTSVQAHAKGAQLLLYPTRVVLENGEKTATVGLKNPGDGTGNYRIEIIDMEMKEEGTSTIAKDQEVPYSAQRMLRISPRSITLAPGQDQNIRLMVREPRALEDGEYRSHLQITLVEDNVGGESQPAEMRKNAAGIQVKSQLVVVIPIIIRHGKTSYDVKITDAKLRYSTSESGQKVPYVDLNFIRTGNRSSMGDIDVTYITPEGKKYVVKHVAGVPIYRSTERRKIVLPLDIPSGLTIGKGTLHVTYRAQDTENKKLLAEGDFSL